MNAAVDLGLPEIKISPYPSDYSPDCMTALDIGNHEQAVFVVTTMQDGDPAPFGRQLVERLTGEPFPKPKVPEKCRHDPFVEDTTIISAYDGALYCKACRSSAYPSADHQ